MKFLGQDFQTLKHEEDRQTDRPVFNLGISLGTIPPPKVFSFPRFTDLVSRKCNIVNR